MQNFSDIYITSEKRVELCTLLEAEMGENNVLLLIRGLPGMGKTTLGKQIAEKYNGLQFESDNNFVVDGVYRFDPSLLSHSHELTQNHTRQALQAHNPLVIVSNTFTRYWEYEAYLNMASQCSYSVVIFDLYLHLARSHSEVVVNSFPSHLQQLSVQNLHDVPYEKIIDMSNRYEFCEEEIVTIRGSRPTSLSPSSPS